MSQRVERLSDHLYHLPVVQDVRARDFGSERRLESNRELLALLQPVQSELSGDVLCTSVVSTPALLRDAFGKDPWDVLMSVRPAHRPASAPVADAVPVLFLDDGRSFVGWQMRGALPSLFGCEFGPQPCSHWLQDARRLPEFERSTAIPRTPPSEWPSANYPMNTISNFLSRARDHSTFGADPEGALSWLTRALRMVESAPVGQEFEYQCEEGRDFEKADILQQIGDAFHHMGDNQAAAQKYTQAAQIAEKWGKHENARVLRDIARSFVS